MWTPSRKAPSLKRNLKVWALNAFAVLALFAAVVVVSEMQHAEGAPAPSPSAPVSPAEQAEAKHYAAVEKMIAQHGSACWTSGSMPAAFEGQFPGGAIVDHQTKRGVRVEYVTDPGLVGAAIDLTLNGERYPGLVEVYRFCR